MVGNVSFSENFANEQWSLTELIAIKVTYKRITFLIEIHTLLVVGKTSNNHQGEWVFWLYKSNKVVNIVLCFQGIQNMIHDETPL